ncbi:PiggyBac transposable element-derived protein 4 [Eumeta japonica]|uniref:ATP-dependent DNA helicase n=1 Tax=Eumeta variegata TaxID=151549 RepID=A0A4C1WP14_EUMVA|nr:PiggyBac transposable element-derived protein 4 [Eumeta japonica]
MWCRCESSTGYLYQFDLYTGKKTNTEIGLGETVALCLTEQLKGLGCEVYFDNFFNSPALQHKLMMQNTKACGTVRTNRKNVPKSLPSDKSMKRGDIHAVSTNGITFVKWMDTKAVHMLTNFISPVPTSTVKRRQAGTAQKINVTCPEVVMRYNKYIGGVDLMDQRKACYEVDRKAKVKYYLRLFFDILDIAKNNSYLVYVKLHEKTQSRRQRSRPTLVSSKKLRVGNKRNLPAHNMEKAEKLKRCLNILDEPVDQVNGTEEFVTGELLVGFIMSITPPDQNYTTYDCIESILLPHGRTSHKIFGLRVPLTPDSASSIKPNSSKARQLAEIDIFLMDEAPMLPKYGLQNIDQLLRFVGNPDLPFGGKVMIDQQQFANYLLKLGNGELPLNNMDEIELSLNVISTGNLIDEAFSNCLASENYDGMKDRAIIAPLNKDVDKINSNIVAKLPGEYKIYYSNDSVKDQYEGALEFTTEFLNSVNISDLPPHELKF